ncbi:DNRLRE domain-containing protein [Macrococcoides caseolyticum]|uniref:DNRLRE domain-containing protein n=1 Tax=Macrococcoides caseolyticum TaxID=69966 RepID=UPI000C34B960|nr:DNRLRE domain-containing protein [Macrococcus caseolyticus]PKE06430.1 hypothetical protein CW692_08325 [Macrococcus caseolyticus]PKE23553.1 hypothetical protein CW689_08405 [Macrococcus caseolyticus]
MERKFGFKTTIWGIVLSLILSLLPIDTMSANAEESSKEKDEQKAALLEAPETFDGVDNSILEKENKDIVIEEKDDGKYEATFYDDEVKIEDGKGISEIDPSLSETAEGYSPEKTEIEATFSEKLQKDQPYLKLKSDAESKTKVTFRGIEYKDRVEAPREVQSEVKENTIWYKNIIDDVDLRHITLNKEVKEDIVINRKTEDIRSIVYDIATEDIVTLSKDNEILFTDKNGNLTYKMPKPEMSDSHVRENSGFSEKSYDVKYKLTKNEGKYQLKVIPDQQWLSAPERVYPIYIDPTFSKDVTADTFVSSAQPGTNLNKYWNSTLGFYSLRVGKYDNATGTNYAFLKFPGMTSLLGANVSSASLKAHTRWNYYGTKRTDVWIDKVNGDWSDTKLTWNNKPSSTNIGKAAAATNEWLNFNVLSYAKGVANGTADNGVKLHINGNGQAYWKQISASENAANKAKVSVVYSYPKMDGVSTEPFTIAGTKNGYINVTWPAKKGAKKYRLQMFDGLGWQTIYTGTSRAYNTKGKKLWPTAAQYGTKDSATKGIKFRNDDGQDLPLDPSDFYSKSRGKASTDKTFQFRVIADYALGSGQPSDADRQSILELIPETPKAPVLKSVVTDNSDKATVDIRWTGAPGAASYNVYMFNGTEYQKIDTVKGTTWSSKGKKLFPTDAQLKGLTIGSKNSLRTKGDGVELRGDASLLYKKVSTKYQNTKNYYFKVSAHSGKGESGQSDFLRVFAPTKSVAVHLEGYSDNRKEDSGFLFANWDKVNGADGYAVYLFNGKQYELVEVLDKETTSWHSREKKLWPLEKGKYTLNNNGTVGGGKELPLDPSATYASAGGEKDNKYKVKVTSFRKSGANTGKVERNFSGESSLSSAEEKEVELKSDAAPDYGDEAFYPTIETDLGKYNIFNDNQVLTEGDAKLPGRGADVEATRTFNSKKNQTGMFGLGWTSSFERRLHIADETTVPKVVQYSDIDGSIHLFVNHKNKLLAPTGVDYEFLIEGNQYVIQDESGQREVYGKDGLLQRIEYDVKQKDKKNAIRFEYEQHEGGKRLKQILSASDSGTGDKNRITFNYNDENLVSDMTVSGTSDDKTASRVFTYEYDPFNRLTAVSGPDGKYTYTYRKTTLTEDSEQPNDEVLYASEISKYGLPGNENGSDEIVATYEEDVLKSVKDETGVETTYAIDKNEKATTVDVQVPDRVKEQLVFDASGHLITEGVDSDKKKETQYEWKDHRITRTIYPDGEVEVSEYGKREAASKSGQELDGQVLKEKDATTQTTYEYADNKDDIIATTDEHNVKEEVAFNSDREEVTDYSVQDAVTGFTEYDQFGNETRTGISLAAGSNLIAGGAFETKNQFSAGKIVDGGIHGKALQLTNETAKQELSFKAGQPINISGSFKADKAAKGNIHVKFMDSASKVLSTVTIDSPKVDGKWVRKLEEAVAPKGTAKLSVELVSTKGSVSFDEVQLETAESGHSTSVTSFNFVEQGGFNKVDQWKLTSGKTTTGGIENSEALSLSPGGTAAQKVNIVQDTAKPVYVTALAKSANADDKIKAVITFSDGATVTQEKAFQTLDQNSDLWQRQILQFNEDNKQPIKTVDVTLSNKDGATLFDGVRVTEGRAVEATTYDKQHNFVTKESGLSKIPVVYENDAFGNVLSTTQGTKKRLNVYDNRDNLIKTTAENGAVISYDFNKKNQVTAKHFEGQDTSYTYSKNRISSVKTADGQVTHYRYHDKTGDISRIDLPSGKSIVTKYDEEGREKAVNDGNSDLFTYSYDKADNITGIKDTTNNKTKTYTYVSNIDGVSGNGAGRLLSVTDYFGLTQSFEYVKGVDGINTELPASVVFNGMKTAYGYDKATRLDKVEVGINKWLFRHDELGQVNEIKLPNNAGEVNYKFGENGAVESITSESKTENVVADQYGYDAYGNMTQKISKDGATTYQYDAMDQLTEEKIGDKTNTYTYDKRGNRTGLNGTEATFNTMNQLTAFGGEKIAYDADGNRTSDGAFEYSWNGLGQLIKVTNKSNKQTWYYQYDEQGRRITKTHNDTTIHYHYDNDTNHLIAESMNGKVIRAYIRDQEGNLLGLKVGDQIYNYHKNYRGDIVGITDTNGNSVASYSYDSWGNIIKSDVKDDKVKGQPFRYASYFFDEELEQYYLMARYYHPKQGVFLSVDPELSDDETVEMNNAYSYSANNPVMKYDSTGRWVWLVPAAVWVYRGYKGYKMLKKAKKAGKAIKLVNRHKGQQFRYKGQMKYKGGRGYKNQRLRQLVNNPKQPRHVRGWLKNEQRRVQQGRSKYLRNPQGYDLAHYRGYEASKGFSYRYSYLNTRKNHRLQHKYDKNGKRNKRFVVRRR